MVWCGLVSEIRPVVKDRMAISLLCSPSWIWTDNSLAPISQVLELKITPPHPNLLVDSLYRNFFVLTVRSQRLGSISLSSIGPASTLVSFGEAFCTSLEKVDATLILIFLQICQKTLWATFLKLEIHFFCQNDECT